MIVDNADNVRAIAAALADQSAKAGASLTLHVLVEVNVGHGRCGVASAEEAVALAQLICTLPGLVFAGIHGYQGMTQHVRRVADRAAAG